MRHAFPEDELRPLSCRPQTRNSDDDADIGLNDVLGNYSLTLIDSLSTLAILASGYDERDEKDEREGRDVRDDRDDRDNNKRNPLRDFQNGIKSLVDLYGDGSNTSSTSTSRCGTRACGFDLDSKVQVFETNIRGVGGLLSAHLFAVGHLPITNYHPTFNNITWPNGFVYSDQLLFLARDLATRLLPAFSTQTGIPYPRVNLRTGIPFYLTTDGFCYADGSTTSDPGHRELTENCAAGAGSLILEFSTLSRLTGDPRFESLAKRAFWAIWSRRSSLHLLGNGIDAESGHWTNPPLSGIGAGIDSFFEYSLKSHILLSDLPSTDSSSDHFLQVWHQAHAAVRHHIYRSAKQERHPFYAQVDTTTGAMRYSWIDNLSAYYPGLLVLAGELDEAIESHLLFSALWTRYAALPERWNTANGYIDPHFRHWAGRPEFVESTFHLYQATKDPWFLRVGEMVLRDITRRCWTECGWADLGDVVTGERRDRMESFFLGETVKYLYLLFDESHPLNRGDGAVVFTTEGHPLVIPRRAERKRNRHSRQHTYHQEQSPPPPSGLTTCPIPAPALPLTISNIPSRPDFFHAAALAQLYKIPTQPSRTSDLAPAKRSPSGNYTFYPWTLPLSLIPSRGWSSAIVSDVVTTLTFPALQDGVGALGAVQKIAEGLVVRSLSNMRFSLVEEVTEGGEVVLRIQGVGGLMLGREEWVFVSEAAVRSVGGGDDEQFRRVWDGEGVDLWVEMSEGHDDGEEMVADVERDGREDMKVEGLMEQIESILSTILGGAGIDKEAALAKARDSLLLQQQQPRQPHTSKGKKEPNRYTLPAILPSGPGAAPLPAALHHDGLPGTSSPLPWTKFFWLDGELCPPFVLPAHIVAEYDVVVIRRGGCEFSHKVRSLPALTPSSRLELLVIVDHGDGGGLVRPWLGERQRTPGGMHRVREVGMVLVGELDGEVLEGVAGGKGGWSEKDGKWWDVKTNRGGIARIGGRRRVRFESLGVRIANLGVV